MAPSRLTDIMPQTIHENIPQDFIGNKQRNVHKICHVLVMVNEFKIICFLFF